MDEDADGALRAAEHAGDLRGGHLVDEPQDERATSIGGQPADRPPRRGPLRAPDRAALDVERIADHTSCIEGGRRVASPTATLVGDDVAGDPEQPDPERGGAIPVSWPRSLLEPGQVGQGKEERPLGRVLRVVVIAELVVRVGIHLGEVPAVEGFEGGWVAPGGLDERSIAVEPADSGAPDLLGCAHPSKHRASHPVTPVPRVGRGRPRRSRRSARRRGASGRPRRGHRSGGPRRPLGRTPPGRPLRAGCRGRS